MHYHTKQIRKLILYGLVLLAMVHALIVIVHNRWRNSSERIEEIIQQNFVKDSLLLSDVSLMTDSKVQSQLENSIFSIKAHKKDTLVFWTNQINLKSTQLPKSQFQLGDLKIEFIVNNKKLNEKLGSHQIEFTPDKIGVKSINIFGKTHHYNILQKSNLGSIGLVLFFLWLVGIVLLLTAMLFAFRSEIFFSKGVNGTILYFGAVVALWIIFNYIGSNILFVDTPLAELKSICKILPQDYLSIFSNLIFVSFFFLGASSARTKDLHNMWPMLIQYFVGTILTSIIFFDILCKIEGFIGSGAVEINIDEILRLRWQDLLFIIGLVFYCFLAFYLPIQFFKNITHSILSWKKTIVIAASILLVSLLYIFTGHQLPLVPVFLFLMVYFLTLDIYVEYLDKNISFILWWIVLFSGFLAFSIYAVSIKKEISNRKESIDTAFTYLNFDTKENFSKVSNKIVESDLIEKLSLLSYPAQLEYNDLMGYIQNIIHTSLPKGYELTGLECFDQKGTSLFSNHLANQELQNRKLGESTKLADRVYYSPLYDEVIYNYQIDNLSFIHNPINLILTLSSEHSKFVDGETEINYVVLKDNNIILSHIDESENASMYHPTAISEDQMLDDVSYVVAKSGDYKIVSFKKMAGLIKPISLFSLCFSITGLITLLLAFLNTRFSFLPIDLNLKLYKRSSLRTRIQSAIILLILISFFIIGLTTAYYYNKLYHVNNQKSFRSELTTMINDIDIRVQEYSNSEGVSSAITKIFNQLSIVHNRNMVYYDGDGKEIVHSNKYKNYFNILPFTLIQRFKQENGVNPIKTLSKELSDGQILVPIYAGNDVPKGYLTIEGESEQNGNKGLFEFLGTLLNVYIFLFLLAGALSIAIANSITLPLARLAESVKKFKLGMVQDSLKWESNDEIGLLIKNYNNLTIEVAKGAELLAKTQRDMAWREMAKQVAHEIKNPLTPMKLSIQYLDKVVKNDPANAQGMIEKISATLIEQINNLTQIANEFSNFATLPKASNEKIILNEVVEHIHDLFRKRDDMDIEMIEPMNEIYVFADRNHLVRILNNIVKNAIQAIPDDKRGKIIIDLQKTDDVARIKVSDNGVGISKQMRDKVFTPNFTTKSSGTGLGLAISANMMETMNGRIYFESEEEVGTDFFIELPLMKSDTLEEDQVFLDD